MAKLLSGFAVLLVLLVGAQAGGHGHHWSSGCPPPPVTQASGCPPPPCGSSPPPPCYYSPPPPVHCPPPPCHSPPPPPVKIYRGCPPPPVYHGCPPPPVTMYRGCPPPPVYHGCPPPPVKIYNGCPPPPCTTPVTTYKCGTLGLSYSSDLSIFLSLVYACGADVISIWENASSKFTILAPVNDAFKGYDIPKLMANKEQVRYLVGAHLLWNTWLPDQYSSCNGNEYTTLSSTKCNIYTDSTKTWAQTCMNTATFVPKRWTVCQVQIVPILTVLKYNNLY